MTAVRWKRQVTAFAALTIALVIGVATGSAALMWHLMQEVAADGRASEARIRTATSARLAVMDVDRLLLHTIAQTEPDAVRTAAVASIAAASRLEDAITALRGILPDDADAAEMARLVEGVKAPRMKVISLARKGEPAQALQQLASIDGVLKRIDALSGAIVQAQGQVRLNADAKRQTVLRRMLGVLMGAAGGGVALSLLFYWRLMKRLKRTDEVEQLLGEVHCSAERLDADSQRLAQLNCDVRQANARLSGLLGRFRASFGAMDGDSRRSLEKLQALSQTFHGSMATSRQQAADADIVARQINTTARQMQGLHEATEALNGSRSRIATFTESIERISSTTRLLSMNAAVEAARAGEAGRGFNVVATSIRQLSEDTRTAAVEIRRASEDIDGQLSTTAQLVQQTHQLMDDCAQRMAALEASATQSCALAESMGADMKGFRAAFERQTECVREMDADVSALDGTLQAGHSHAQLLDGTAQALSDASSRMLQRVASVMQ